MIGRKKGWLIGEKGVIDFPKFPAFLFLLPPQFSFFLSLGVFWWNFGGVLKRRGPEMSTFGVLWLSCEAPAARFGGAAKISHDKSPNVHISRPRRFKNITKIQRKDPKREKE